jgi:dynein heavy chain
LHSLDQKNLLDDQQLIDVLKQTKVTSADIAVRLTKNEEAEKNLNLARQKYAAIAVRASILYFTVQNLTSLNVMYQFSLSWFYSVFQSCLSGPSKKKTSIMIGGEQVDLAPASKATNKVGAIRRGSNHG